MEWLRLGTSDQLSEHRRHSVCELLRGGDRIERCALVNFDAIQSHDELLGFAKGNLVGGGPGLVGLADSLSDVERDTSSRPHHLAAKAHFPTGELSCNTSYAAIEVERTAVNVEPMEVVSTWPRFSRDRTSWCVDRVP